MLRELRAKMYSANKVVEFLKVYYYLMDEKWDEKNSLHAGQRQRFLAYYL